MRIYAREAQALPPAPSERIPLRPLRILFAALRSRSLIAKFAKSAPRALRKTSLAAAALGMPEGQGGRKLNLQIIDRAEVAQGEPPNYLSAS